MNHPHNSLVFRKGLFANVIFLGVLLSAGYAHAADSSFLSGRGNLGVELQSDFFSRDIKTGISDDRLRVARQTVRFSYGLVRWMDFFIQAGLGRVEFQANDLSSETRPVAGTGIRIAASNKKGYFAGLSYLFQLGEVQKFKAGGDQTLTIKDEWTEQDMAIFAGTKDLIYGPNQDGRIYLGLRLSNREDDLTFENGSSLKAQEDTTFGGFLGLQFSDSKVFNARLEVGTGDRNSVLGQLGLVF